MSSFNPDLFMQSTVESANDTKVIPCPVGEYTAVCKEVKARPWSSKDGSNSGVALDVVWTIDDEAARQATGRNELNVRQGVMLDMLESGTALDMGKGKNVQLGRLREATDLNTPGQPFSFTQLVGRAAKVMVTHRIAGEDTFDEIKRVAKLA